MKKTITKLTAFIAIMLLTTTAYAQEFHLGAKAGANLGKLDGVAYSKGFKLGYQLGGFVEYLAKLTQSSVIVINQYGMKSLIKIKL